MNNDNAHYKSKYLTSWPWRIKYLVLCQSSRDVRVNTYLTPLWMMVVQRPHKLKCHVLATYISAALNQICATVINCTAFNVLSIRRQVTNGLCIQLLVRRRQLDIMLSLLAAAASITRRVRLVHTVTDVAWRWLATSIQFLLVSVIDCCCCCWWWWWRVTLCCGDITGLSGRFPCSWEQTQSASEWMCEQVGTM